MRKLTLKKENLVELSTEELTDVQGGALSGPTCPYCSGIVSCATVNCLESLVSC